MRFPYRVVGDYHVDRPQVYRQKCQSRAVLIARRLQYENFRPFECLSLGDIRGKPRTDIIQVVTATGIHLFPFRTEKLSPFTPMILLYQVGKWVAANFKRPSEQALEAFSFSPRRLSRHPSRGMRPAGRALRALLLFAVP